MTRFGVSSAVALFGIVACSSSNPPGENDGSGKASGPPVKTAAYVAFDASQLCDLLVNKCAEPGATLTMADCLKDVPLVVVPPDCKAAFDKASAEATCTTGNDVINTCFPSCDAATVKPACDGTNIQLCSNNLTYTYPCDKVCAAVNGTFTGTCGSTFAGQTSPTDKCFCVQ
jgi:hypothetical protein